MRDREATAAGVYIQGKPASDLEANAAVGLDANGLDYTFQYFVETAYTLPGEEKEVDFMVWQDRGYPVEIDGNWTHKSAEQQEYDRVRDNQINDALMPHGFAPVQRLTEEWVLTPEAAAMTFRELF